MKTQILRHRYAYYVPSVDRNRAPIEDREAKLNAFIALLLEDPNVTGCTVESKNGDFSHICGYWKDETGSLVREGITRVIVWTEHPLGTNGFSHPAHVLLTEWDQESVACEVLDQFILFSREEGAA